MIAFSIATNTQLLIFDEPTNGLDIPSKSQFRKTIASLDADSRSIVISTHQVRDIGTMLDHMMVLKDGSIVFNQELARINENLSFKKIKTDSTEDYIYGEEVLGGIDAIFPFAGNGESDIDLELLFNGIIQNTTQINQAFEELNS
jgi:ABC-2 type transport system ATP-binding protein